MLFGVWCEDCACAHNVFPSFFCPLVILYSDPRVCVGFIDDQIICDFALHRSYGISYRESLRCAAPGFGSAWRTTTVLAILAFGAANFAPSSLFSSHSADEEHQPWLTRVLAHYAPSAERTTEINLKTLGQTNQLAEETLLVRDAKKPAMRRFRYPLYVLFSRSFLWDGC